MESKISIGLHTGAHAERLSQLLANEGVNVDLVPITIDGLTIENPVRMEIDLEMLPKALRIIENIEIFNLDNEKSSLQVKPKKTAKDIFLGKKSSTSGDKGNIIVPVDFSDYSLRATHFAFHVAKKLGARITLLNAYILPSATDNFSLSPDTLAFEPCDMEVDLTIEETAKAQMQNLTAQLRNDIKEGIIPPVKFTVEIQEGLPEAVINEYAREIDTLLIIMGTRGANKKNRELVGSITAEVLDTSRFPVITIPETIKKDQDPDKVKNVAFFCNLDNDDIGALNFMNRIFPDTKFSVSIYYITSRKDKFNLINSNDSLKKLTTYCRSKFSDYTFTSHEIQPKEAKDLFIDGQITDIDFILVPNKRRHALARLFNPGLAHRLLFVADFAMLVVPV